MSASDFDCYSVSDESSESELMERSLSVWNGFTSYETGDDFVPVLLDLHTASSIGQEDCVRSIIERLLIHSHAFGCETTIAYFKVY